MQGIDPAERPKKISMGKTDGSQQAPPACST
jgi:hypothetical protein